MSLAKFDELDSLIRGMLYIETTNPHECYYWAEPTDDSKCHKIPFDFSKPYPFLVSQTSLLLFSSYEYYSLLKNKKLILIRPAQRGKNPKNTDVTPFLPCSLLS